MVTFFVADFGKEWENEIDILMELFVWLFFFGVKVFDHVSDGFVAFGVGDSLESFLRELEVGGKLQKNIGHSTMITNDLAFYAIKILKIVVPKNYKEPFKNAFQIITIRPAPPSLTSAWS